MLTGTQFDENEEDLIEFVDRELLGGKIESGIVE